MTTRAYNAPHIGLTVPDLSAAIAWYTHELGFRLLTGPLRINEDGSPIASAAQAVYGEGFTSFQFAHLASPDDVGLELFQFRRTATDPGSENFTYWRKGYNHLGLTAPDVERAVRDLIAAGGRARTQVLLIDEVKGYKIAYCEDPWGNVIEFCSHPYVTMWSNQAIN
ncbi:VOC family protein [Marinobacter segnicrescens]|uniref:VOC family protein n=1 Tax=Marinobacter segnicrescens TaxID=430453 RepID=UPI00064580A7